MRTKALTVEELERINHVGADRLRRVELELAKAAMLAGDGRKQLRLIERECRACYYVGNRLAGQAFTSWLCPLCGDQYTHPNTAVPRACHKCADAFRLCMTCGGDIDMRHRSKRDRRAIRAKKPRTP